MKNRNIKIVTLILSCLLLIGCCFAIAAAAEDAPAAQIVRKNIAYEGAVKIVYAIDAQNVADTQEVKLYFYDSADAEEPYEVKALFDQKVTIDGKEYAIAFSAGIAPKDMRKSIFAKPVVLEGGEVIAEGAMVEYSIWQYAINQFSKTVALEDQLALYTDLLDYGANVQKVLMADGNYTAAELELAGGYANEYYVLDLKTVVDGNGVQTARATFAPEEILSSDFELQAKKVVSGAYFNGFTDANGNAIKAYGDKTSASWNKTPLSSVKLGINNISLNYKTPENGKIYTFDSAEELDANRDVNCIDEKPNAETGAGTTTLTTDKNGNAATTVIPNKAFAVVAEANGETVLEYTKRIRVLSDTVYADDYEGDKSGAYAAGDFYDLANMGTNGFYLPGTNDTIADATVKMHVFETDIKVSTGKDATLQLSFRNSAANIWQMNFSSTAANVYNLTVLNGGQNNATIKSNVDGSDWLNLRIEIYPTTVTQLNVRVYVNGECADATTLNKPSSTKATADGKGTEFTQLGFYYTYGTEDTSVLMDNMLIETVRHEDNFGTGLYYNDEKTNKDGEILSTYTFEANKETYTDTDGNTAIKITKGYTDSKNLLFGINEFGCSKYVFEADVKWIATTFKTAEELEGTNLSNKSWGGRIGFRSHESYSGGNNDTKYVALRQWQTAPDYGFVINHSGDGNMKAFTEKQQIAPGYWFNLRYEYIPLGYDAATAKYTTQLNVYINNVLAATSTSTSTFSNFNCKDFAWWLRNYSGSYGAEFLLDNIFVGGVGEYNADTFDDGAVPKNYAQENQKNSTTQISYNIATMEVVDNPLHNDPTTAANRVLKIEMTNYDPAEVGSKGRVTFDLNVITLQNKGVAQGTGVYEFSYDMYYDGYTKPASGNKLIQSIIPRTSTGYFQLAYIHMGSDGKLDFSTTVGQVGGVGGGKGGTIVNDVAINEGFNNIKWIFTKNGTDTQLEIIVNGVSVAKKNYFHNSPTACDNLPLSDLHWRFSENLHTNENGETVNDYKLYIDNVTYKYVGPIEN